MGGSRKGEVALLGGSKGGKFPRHHFRNQPDIKIYRPTILHIFVREKLILDHKCV